MIFGDVVVAMTTDELLRVYAGAPQWIGEALGPKMPLLGGKRAHIEISAIFRETREEAREVLMLWVHEQCTSSGFEYVEDDWTVLRLELVNGS